jgi:hypothetical protein
VATTLKKKDEETDRRRLAELAVKQIHVERVALAEWAQNGVLCADEDKARHEVELLQVLYQAWRRAWIRRPNLPFSTWISTA